MGATGNSSNGSGTKLPDAISITSKSQIAKLQNDMGQSGNEAGYVDVSSSNKLYVNSGKSMCINAYLNSDGKTYKAEGTDWSNYINSAWVKNAIQKIDSGMKPLTESINVTRYVDAGAISSMIPGLGVNKSNIGKFIDKLEDGTISKKDFRSVLQSVDYTHKAYTSTTYDTQHGTYGNRDIRLNMVLRKGTNAIVTNNHAEHEILVGHGQKYNFTGNYSVETVTDKSGKKKKQLVLDVYI